MPIPHPSFRAIAFFALILLVSSSGVWAGYFSRIVIDPGHGGDDRGGRSGKVYEKHLALDTAMRLEHYLLAKGYQVTMTRKSDTLCLARQACRDWKPVQGCDICKPALQLHLATLRLRARDLLL